METNEEVLRAKIADLEKENEQLWEREFERTGQPAGSAVAQTHTVAESGAVAGVCELSDETRVLRPVSCPGCGGQNTADGVCLHCGVAHEMWQ